MKRWGEGISQLSPATLMKARVRAHFWGAIGLSIGLFFLLIQGIWGFIIFIIAMIYLQWHEYRGSREKYYNLKKIEDEVIENLVLKKL